MCQNHARELFMAGFVRSQQKIPSGTLVAFSYRTKISPWMESELQKIFQWVGAQHRKYFGREFGKFLWGPNPA